MVNKKSKYLFLFIVFLFSGCLFAQKIDYNAIQNLLDEGENKSAIKILEKATLYTKNKNDLAKINHYIGLAYVNENEDDTAFKYFRTSKNIYLSIDSLDQAMNINLELAELFSTENHFISNPENYIKDYIAYAKKSGNDKLLAKGYNQWATLKIVNDPKESLAYFRMALQKNERYQDDGIYFNIYNNMAVLYNESLKNHDSAIFYLGKALIIAVKKNNPNDICINFINQAASYNYLGNYNKSIELLHDAQDVPITKNILNTKGIIKKILSINYEAIQDYENAYYSLNDFQVMQDSLNIENQKTNISEFQTKYKTQEKVKENQTLKSKIFTKNILMYSLIGLILVSIFLVILGYKYINKKRLIAEQEKQIESQKLEKTLKDQELHDIDLMLESQEYERQRIANELHDNLGSLIATIKLNFQNIRNQTKNFDVNKQIIFDTTDELIEETYNEVRNIAHLKNLGIIGTDGLLLAVKKMAEKMSHIDNFKVLVIPFGLKERFDNRLEVIIFRIIQELCTNIIKHSKATDVTIYLTQHSKKDMNIIIEDNGIGFDYSKIKDNNGIGLKNIEKRVEQMNGTFTVDSILSKGTTIIIEIPL